jgi:hypothetical protein
MCLLSLGQVKQEVASDCESALQMRIQLLKFTGHINHKLKDTFHNIYSDTCVTHFTQVSHMSPFSPDIPSVIFHTQCKKPVWNFSFLQGFFF